MNIPTVDLRDLSDVDPERQKAAHEALRIGFGQYGLVYVRNHHLSPEALDAYYDRFTALTSRPEDEKRGLARGDIWFQRGWTPPNTEQAVLASGQPDFKECYFAAPMPLDAECALQYPEMYAPNVWPPIDGFEETYMSVGRKMHEVGVALLRGCAAALNLPIETFEAKTRGAPHVTRALRYLPLNAEQVKQNILWGEEHTDFNLLTILPGGRFIDPKGVRCAPPDEGSGLYLRTRPSAEHPTGVLVHGRAPAGCMVAQVGQQLEILTGGTFLATPHVVTAPKTPGYARLSSAHFVHLHPHQILYPLEPFRTIETIKAYSPPVLAGTYDLKTLVDIALAPRDALNALGYRHYERLENIRAAEEH